MCTDLLCGKHSWPFISVVLQPRDLMEMMKIACLGSRKSIYEVNAWQFCALTGRLGKNPRLVSSLACLLLVDT